MNQVNPLDKLQSVQQQLMTVRWRLPVLLCGEPDRLRQQVVEWVGGSGEVLWLSRHAPADAWCLDAGRANHELGREADTVIVDLFDGVAVDAIAALAGVIRAGGVMLFLGPALDQWSLFADPQYQRITVEPYGVDGVRHHFLTRLSAWFANDKRVLRLVADDIVRVSVLDGVRSFVVKDDYQDELGCRTPQQREVVRTIEHMASRPHCAPLVIQADRGRGKSAALGIAAGRLQMQGLRIVVTAPRPEAAETLLQFAAQKAGQIDRPLQEQEEHHFSMLMD